MIKAGVEKAGFYRGELYMNNRVWQIKNYKPLNVCLCKPPHKQKLQAVSATCCILLSLKIIISQIQSDVKHFLTKKLKFFNISVKKQNKNRKVF